MRLTDLRAAVELISRWRRMGGREGTGVERWTASAQLPEGEAAASTQSQVSLHIQVGIQNPHASLSLLSSEEEVFSLIYPYIDFTKGFVFKVVYQAGWNWMETNPIWQSFPIGKQLKYRGPTFKLTPWEYFLSVWRG